MNYMYAFVVFFCFEAFKLGETKFRELRPFYVKDATRETCMCIYHLRWSEFATGLLNYRHRLRKEKVSTCAAVTSTG